MVEEKKATTLNISLERRIFPKGKDERGRPYADLRWSRFKQFEPREMFKVVDEHVFPFLRTLGSADVAVPLIVSGAFNYFNALRCTLI